LGHNKLIILRNHGLLTVGRTVEAAIASFVTAERVAEVHVKAPNGKAISDEAAKIAASTLQPDHVAWRTFHWLDRSIR
jgi:ribulose-5-phosphate 4-epimerase/fuculose-1-phosphate aldolase